MAHKKKLKFTQTINAAPAHVYRAFATGMGLQEWMAELAEADARPGGRFYAWWNGGFYTAGLFEEAVKNEKLRFSWHAVNEPAPTKVTVRLAPAGEGTKLTLVHEGLGAGEEWAPVAENFQREWTSSLSNLKSVLETGLDRRLYDRPMLGFYIGGLVDENLKQRLGLPIDHGLHVSGVLDGMGAQRSGLQADDVIAEVAGTQIREFQSIASVLSGRKGGDVVRTVVYRGPEKMELDVELSRRPEPEYPAAPAELAELGRKQFRKSLSALKKLLKGVSDEEASREPGPGQWSAKKVMAHVLISERWSQLAWDRMPDGARNPDIAESERSIQAIAETYSLKQLYKELKLSVDHTLKMIESAPVEFTGNKAAYFQLANWLQNTELDHLAEHVNQIKAALAGARKEK